MTERIRVAIIGAGQIAERVHLPNYRHRKLAGATLFPAQIYRDEKGELTTVLKRDTADDKRYEKSMNAFIDKCLGKDVMLAGGEQGYRIQQLVDALYKAAGTGEAVLF